MSVVSRRVYLFWLACTSQERIHVLMSCEKRQGLFPTSTEMHIGCRGEPFRWEKAAGVSTFYWSSRRKSLSEDETNSLLPSCVHQVVGHRPQIDRACDPHQGETAGDGCLWLKQLNHI